MPFVPHATEDYGPDEPHLALLVDPSGARLAIRPGASLWLVENKADASKIYPLTLKKVSHKKLTFVMEGVEYTYTLTTAKPKSKEAMQKLLANRGDAPTKFQK